LNSFDSGLILDNDQLTTTAEDPNGCHSYPLQIGKGGYNLQELSKIGQLKSGKNVAWSDESRILLRHSDGEFGVNRMRTWSHHALLPLCRLVVVV